MKRCLQTITVYNAQYEESIDGTAYERTIIDGVSWYGTAKSTVDTKGLKVANQYTVRIPMEANFHGKRYVKPIAFTNASDKSKIFTLNEGDFIVLGKCELINPKPSDIKKAGMDIMTILSVTDNSSAYHAPHIKVVGN